MSQQCFCFSCELERKRKEPFEEWLEEENWNENESELLDNDNY